MTNAEIFRKAADYIGEHGWQQYGVGFDGGPRCVWGAVKSIVDERPTANAELSRPYMERIGEWLGLKDPSVGAVIGWNWEHGRTAEDVISLFAAVATAEELKEQIAAFDEDLKAAATPVANDGAQLPKGSLSASNGNTPPADKTIPIPVQITQASPTLLKEGVPA